MKCDVVVVGARCAGAPLAMLLSRAGLRVLVVDKARWGSDILNGHVIKQAGVSRLMEWDLLDRVLATGVPPVRLLRLVLGNLCHENPNHPGAPPLIAPRRYELDRILAEASAAAGAEVRMETVLEQLLIESGRVVGALVSDRHGRSHELRADLVVGADGRNSKVARLLGSQPYRFDGTTSIAYWSYWSGVGDAHGTLDLAQGRAVGMFPTNHDSRLVFVQAPASRAAAFRADPEREYLQALRGSAVSDLLAGSRRLGRMLGLIALPNFYRPLYGLGWALAGDAGHHKDPLLARGVCDAFRDAERLACALTRGLGNGEEQLELSLAQYQQDRDAATQAVYESNIELSRLDRPTPDLGALFGRAAEIEAAAEAAFPVLAWPSGHRHGEVAVPAIQPHMGADEVTLPAIQPHPGGQPIGETRLGSRPRLP